MNHAEPVLYRVWRLIVSWNILPGCAIVVIAQRFNMPNTEYLWVLGVLVLASVLNFYDGFTSRG